MDARQRTASGVVWTLLQFVPLLLSALFLSACSGPTDVGGGTGEFITSRKTNLSLRGFLALSMAEYLGAAGGSLNQNTAAEQNALTSLLITSINPQVESGGTGTKPIYPSAYAHLVISNGIGAFVEAIEVRFTETAGGDLLDFRVSPPTPITGQFDFQAGAGLSLAASPITSIGAGLREPQGTPTNNFIPVNVFASGIFDFIKAQPASNQRPLLARITFSGRDVLDNPFRVTGSILVNPFVTDTDNGAEETYTPRHP